MATKCDEKTPKFASKLAWLLTTLVLLSLTTGCERTDTLEAIKERGTLRVVTRLSPTTYYRDNTGHTGFEYQLAERFANHLGVQLELSTESTLSGVFRRLREGSADIAAAGLTLTPARGAEFLHSEAYLSVQPQVIYRTGNTRPSTLAELSTQTILVLEQSSHLEQLKKLSETHADLDWRIIATTDSSDLLDALDDEHPVAILDDYEFKLQQPLYPRLKPAFDIFAKQSLTWYFNAKNDSSNLLESVNLFLQEIKEDGVLDGLAQTFFDVEPLVSRAGSFTFSQNMEAVLPSYEHLIRQVANEYNIDWALLGAMSYQESHWDPKATSFTGVRGMMMLTRRTAKELGVKNRLDPLESLRGGARYLVKLKRRLDPSIAEPDRTYLAMAAYNIGMGHLQDARTLTRAEGDNPDSWVDVMKHLPKLQKPTYYRKARFGYARGNEAVTYVQNIRHYANVLSWRDISEGQILPSHNSRDYLPETLQNLPILGF